MGLLSKLRGETADVVEWIEDGRHTPLWRLPQCDGVIRCGALLIVRTGQLAMLTDGAEVADTFGPGRHELAPITLPKLSELRDWPSDSSSDFRSVIYFATTRPLDDLKWSTPVPVVLHDARFGPVRVRAFGRYTIAVTDPAALLRDLLGTDSSFDPEAIAATLRARAVEAFEHLLAKRRISAIELAQHYRDLGEPLRRVMAEGIEPACGLELQRVSIMNIALPDEIERELDLRLHAKSADLDGTDDDEGLRATPAGPADRGAALADPARPHEPTASPREAQASAAHSARVRAAAPAPPPPPPVVWWHIAIAGQTRGPYSLDEVVSAVQRGQIGADTLVWTTGMAGWQQLHTVPILSRHLRLTPPPLR